MRGFSAVLRKEAIQMSRDHGTIRFAILVPIFQLFLFGVIDTNIRYVPTADVGRTNDIDRQLNFLTGGIFHEPLMIDGLFSLGQYKRNIRMNFPSGAGSQFDSLSGPGESF